MPARALFFGAAGLEPIQSAVLWTAGKRRLDGVYTIVYSRDSCPRQGSLFWCGRGSNPFNQQSCGLPVNAGWTAFTPYMNTSHWLFGPVGCVVVSVRLPHNLHLHIFQSIHLPIVCCDFFRNRHELAVFNRVHLIA